MMAIGGRYMEPWLGINSYVDTEAHTRHSNTRCALLDALRHLSQELGTVAADVHGWQISSKPGPSSAATARTEDKAGQRGAATERTAQGELTDIDRPVSEMRAACQ